MILNNFYRTVIFLAEKGCFAVWVKCGESTRNRSGIQRAMVNGNVCEMKYGEMEREREVRERDQIQDYERTRTVGC